MNPGSLFGPGVSSLWTKGKRRGGRKPRTGLTAGSNLPPDIAATLGEAELFFINGDNDKAIQMLSEVSLRAPKHPEPYSIMALIYEASKDWEKALQMFFLTATYTPKTKSLLQWTKVAELASELGELDQAILALKRCINLAPSPELYQQKIRVFLRQKNLNNAKSTLNKLFSRFDDQEHFLVEFGNLALSLGYSDLAISSYARYIFHLLGTAQVRTDLFPTLTSGSIQLPKHSDYILHHVAYLYEALFKASDALVDKTDGIPGAMELVELCGEWTLAVKASLPPDAEHEVPELPMVVVIIYAVCKFRQEQDGPIAEAMNMLKHVFALLDQGELLPHLLTSTGTAEEASMMTMDTDSIEAYTIEALCDDLDLLRQLTRVALELVRIGANTRAQKVLAFLETCLRSLGRKQIVLDYVNLPTDLLTAAERAILKAKVERDIPQLWCHLASACETLDKPVQALAAYRSALAINVHHAVSLTEYAQLSRTQQSEEDLAAVKDLLQRHFEALVHEFEGIRQQQQGGPGLGTSAASTGAGADGERRRGTKRSATQSPQPGPASKTQSQSQATMDELREVVHQATGGSSASLPVQHSPGGGDGEDQGGAMDVEGEGVTAQQDGRDSEGDSGEDEGEGEDMDDLDSDLGLQDDGFDGDGSPSDDDSSDSGSSDGSGSEDGGEEDGGDGTAAGMGRRRSARRQSGRYRGKARRGKDMDLAQLHWRAANRTTQFTQDDLKAEILALVEWSKLLFDDASLHTFSAVAVPLVLNWIRPTTADGSRGSAGAEGTGGSGGGSGGGAGIVPPKLGRKLRNKEAQTVSMYQLALAPSTVDGSSNAPRGIGLSPAEATQQLLALLDTHQKTNFGMVSALTQVVRLDQILPKEALLSVAAEVKSALEKLNFAAFGAELQKKCNIKSIERGNYSGGRLRTSTVKYVEYSTLDGTGTSGGTTGTGAAGLALSSAAVRTGDPTSGPVVIAWNKIRRPVEDPLITAATRVSERAGQLARKLFDAPHDLHCANEFYTELMLHFDATSANSFASEASGPSGGVLELQVPLGRLALTVPRSCAAQFLAGHDLATMRKHSLAIEKYTAAFILDPTQPLIALTLGAYLLMIAQHKLTKQRHETLFKGIAFIHRYLTLRRGALPDELQAAAEECIKRVGYGPYGQTSGATYTSTSTSNGGNSGSSSSATATAVTVLTATQEHELALYQETCYNLGRAFHEMQLPHLACTQYAKALALADQYDCLCRPDRAVTRLAAHNLVQLYKQSRSKDMALSVMQRFLSK